MDWFFKRSPFGLGFFFEVGLPKEQRVLIHQPRVLGTSVYSESHLFFFFFFFRADFSDSKKKKKNMDSETPTELKSVCFISISFRLISRSIDEISVTTL